MSAQPPVPEIEQLLAELRSDDPKRRQAAATRIAKLRVQNDEINQVLKAIATSDSDWSTQYAAQNALTSLAKQPAKPVAPLSIPTKTLLFTLGFASWYLVNGAAWFAITHQPGFTLSGPAGEGFLLPGLCLWPANIAAPIPLAVFRSTRWVALGLLGAMATNLVVTLVLGTATNGYCFIPFFTPVFN